MRTIAIRAMTAGLGLALASVGALAGDLKIATVDADRLLKKYHKTAQIDARMEEQVAEFTAEGEKMLAEYRRMKKDFEAMRADAGNRALSDEAQEKRVRMAEDKLLDVVEYENKIRETAMSRRQQLDEDRRRARKRLVEEITAVIREYARKQNYTLVVDTSGVSTSGFEPVLFASAATDISGEIEALLNKDMPQGKE